MSDGKGENFIEGRWEDIIADPHRFEGKTVRVSVVEEPLDPEEWKRRFDAWRADVQANPLGPDLPIPNKSERRKIITEILEEKARRGRL